MGFMYGHVYGGKRTVNTLLLYLRFYASERFCIVAR